jgi:hypothetical protein
MKEHKHAAVLRAIADGKEVEFRFKGDVLWRKQVDVANPLSNPHLEWRIKPELKPPIVVEEHFQLCGQSNWSFSSEDIPNIRFTFDPDTGLPIKVELI